MHNKGAVNCIAIDAKALCKTAHAPTAHAGWRFSAHCMYDLLLLYRSNLGWAPRALKVTQSFVSAWFKPGAPCPHSMHLDGEAQTNLAV